jgi:hypothetical protein
MDKETIVKNFIKNFVVKNRRDRVELELTTPARRTDFTGRLNHTWDNILDMRKLRILPKVAEEYLYVKEELALTDNDLCYVISNYEDIDDKVLNFKTAFETCYSRGFGTMILSASADKLYLQTEGDAHRFRFTGCLP